MSAPYAIFISTPNGGQREIPVDTFDDALRLYAEELGRAGPKFVQVIAPDGYDVDCDGEGYFCASDGLTDNERTQVEEVT